MCFLLTQFTHILYSNLRGRRAYNLLFYTTHNYIIIDNIRPDALSSIYNSANENESKKRPASDSTSTTSVFLVSKIIPTSNKSHSQPILKQIFVCNIYLLFSSPLVILLEDFENYILLWISNSIDNKGQKSKTTQKRPNR